MNKLMPSLALILVLAGCRTPAYLGGEFSHRESRTASISAVETFVQRARWVFFWGLLGTEEIDVPEVGGAFDIQKELDGKFRPNERLVEMVVEEGTTLPGVVTSIFTIGIVSQREVVVKARRMTASPPP